MAVNTSEIGSLKMSTTIVPTPQRYAADLLMAACCSSMVLNFSCENSSGHSSSSLSSPSSSLDSSSTLLLVLSTAALSLAFFLPIYERTPSQNSTNEISPDWSVSKFLKRASSSCADFGSFKSMKTLPSSDVSSVPEPSTSYFEKKGLRTFCSIVMLRLLSACINEAEAPVVAISCSCFSIASNNGRTAATSPEPPLTVF